jgi:hypothetical protein
MIKQYYQQYNEWLVLTGLPKARDFESATNKHWRFYSEQRVSKLIRAYHNPLRQIDGTVTTLDESKVRYFALSNDYANSVNAHHCPGRCRETPRQARHVN